MRDIKNIDKFFNEFVSNINEKVYNATEEASKELSKDVQNRIEIPPARNTAQFVAYKNSIESKTEQSSSGLYSETEGTVFSDMKVGGDNPKWVDVPVGAFLEWGTGELGQSTNDYPHGYDYTLHVWDYYTQQQFELTGTFGIRARPHFLPALNAYKQKYEDKVSEAIKKAWKKSES